MQWNRQFAALWHVVLAISLLIGGCGGGDSFEFVCSPPPQIFSTPPTEATVGTAYIYNIDAIHECGFLPAVCTDIEPLVMPPGAIFSGNAIVWVPPPSAAGTNVSFKVRTVPDYCGNSTSQSWTVHVNPDTTPPAVTGVTPPEGAVDVSRYADIRVWFSEPVDPASVTPTSFHVVSSGSGPVAGSITVSGDMVMFKPDALLDAPSTFTVTLSTAIKDPSGNGLASPYVWSFSTPVPDTTPPAVPSALTVDRVTASEVDLSWQSSPSSDVEGYRLYRDGALAQTVTNLVSPRAYDPGLEFASSYCYTVAAYDYSGNESDPSAPPVCTTTQDFSVGEVAQWGVVYRLDGSLWGKTVPDVAFGLTGVTAIPHGGSYRVALKADGSVWQLWATPAPIAAIDGAVGVESGGGHFLVLLSDGTVRGWGRNSSGELGAGTTSDVYVSADAPVAMVNIDQAVAIAGGAVHTLVLRSDGSAWAAGSNSRGQLGNGTTVSSATPVQVSGLSGVIAIAADGYESAALKNDGTVWRWGGLNPTDYVTTPTQVMSVPNAISMSLGSGHILVLKADGSVWAWGRNSSGQLGDGTTIDRNVPVQVSGLSDVRAVSAGPGFSLALKSDGTVWAWGYNASGQLGDGTTVTRLVPVKVLRLEGVNHICALDSTSLALK